MLSPQRQYKNTSVAGMNRIHVLHDKKQNRWFSRYVIAAMLVDGKQKIAH